MDDVAGAVAEDGVILVLPVHCEARRAPFFRQGNSSLRKYQHRGRWLRLPPTVPTLRICGVPTSPAASVMGWIHPPCVHVFRELVSDTAAPIRRPPSGVLARCGPAL